MEQHNLNQNLEKVKARNLVFKIDNAGKRVKYSVTDLQIFLQDLAELGVFVELWYTDKIHSSCVTPSDDSYDVLRTNQCFDWIGGGFEDHHFLQWLNQNKQKHMMFTTKWCASLHYVDSSNFGGFFVHVPLLPENSVKLFFENGCFKRDFGNQDIAKLIYVELTFLLSLFKTCF